MKYYPPFDATDPNASYTNGNELAGIEGSVPDARAIEHTQREIIAVITAAGLVPAEGTLTQLRTAIQNLIAANVVDLSAYAPLASPAFVGNPTAPTQAAGNNTTRLATTAFVRAEVSALVGASPAALDTLVELAAALGNDANFSTTMTNALAAKAPLASPALTGNPTATTQAVGNSSTRIATTAFVQNAVAASLALQAAVATTSGSTIDLGPVPAGAKRVNIHFMGVSMSDANDILIQIGPSGGVETAGYLGGSSGFDAGVQTVVGTTGFVINTYPNAAQNCHGCITLSLAEASTNTWLASGMGRKFIGIELDTAYFDMACRRIEAAYRQGDLFGGIEVPLKQAGMEI